MNMTDPIADLLTRVRNAQRARHTTVEIPMSKLKLEVARILKEEGYIRNYKVVEATPSRSIKVLLKYADDGSPAITGIDRISKPGLRIYAAADKIPSVKRGLGVAILTTSRGVMTGKQARSLGVGGEVLAFVY